MEQMLKIKEAIENADQVLIGIGEEWNVFSKGDGTSDFEADVVGVLALEEDSDAKKNVLEAYKALHALVKDKSYFVVTMNADDLIYQAPFEKELIVAPCGSVHMLQCQQHILESFETEPLFAKAKENKKTTGSIYGDGNENQFLCPACGLPLKLNTIDTKGYLEDGYIPQWKAYTAWLTRTLNKKLCVLELGVSFAHPSVIRFPFEKTAFYNIKATMVRVNDRFHQLPQEMGEKGISVKMNAVDFVHALKEA